MKKLFFLFFCVLGHTTFSQTTNSTLSDGAWYKFAIDTTGVFKIDANFLQNLGININNINPKNIKIYGNGGTMLPEEANDFRYSDLQENAIFIEGEEDERFNSSDYILFYGKGAHDWEVSNTAPINHIQNIYSNKAYYFLKIDDTLGKRIINSSSPNANSVVTINKFDDYIFHEKEETNLFGVGRLWFGENFNVENTRNFTIPFRNAVSNTSLTVKVAGVAISSLTSSMNVLNNGQNIATLSFPATSGSTTSGLARYAEAQAIINATDAVNLTLTYNNNGNPSARAYLDFIEVYGEKQLSVSDFQFSFRSFLAQNTVGVVDFSIDNASAILRIWDVTDPINITNITNENNSGNTFNFKANGGSLREYIVLTENDFYTPELLPNSSVANQNLHSLKDIEYLIITNKELANEGERLALHHRENSNLSSRVVELSKIYNEFSSGSPDVVAIRDFIKHLHDNSSANKKLKYVCFLGDSSYDYKDRVATNNNIVPTFHATQSFNLTTSYVTDDFYAMIDDTDGGMQTNTTIDIATGRIPVSTAQEAGEVITKILSYYETKTFGDWRNNITLVADDIDALSDITLQSGLEEVADSIKRYKPIFNVNKIYADSYRQQISSGGERYPQVKEAIDNSIEKGTLLVNYFGHGGEDGLASERILEIPQIQALRNENTLPLFITVTCEFSRFDNPLRRTAGELLFTNRQGGAVSMITTTRDIFISLGEQFNKTLSKYVLDFDNTDTNIAQNLVKAKNETNNVQKYFIFYFGDPAMNLAIPKPNVRITRMNGVDITQATDTLKALSKVTFQGVVTDNTNTTLTNFNGTVSSTFFDKPIDKQTLDNDGFGVINTFDSQESKLFHGKSSVENGQFNIEFVVPKDIKIAYGKGKISMYADNQAIDKAGANFDITVGGINENAPEDVTGPEMQLFMNDESFIDGANTNSSPNLIVKLSDVSGINTSITAVDHDIVAIIDGNESEPIILNDYYQTELDDFTKGQVTYRLRNLDPGLHTLKVKAWDTYNNSSEATLSFVVVSDANLILDNVLNYPNPFVNYTEFWFNHNRPNETLQAQIQIFTVSGKLIKTINELVQTTGGLSRSITWNGLDDFGNKIGKGVYVYKLKVTTTNSNLTTEKYEKLVIL